MMYSLSTYKLYKDMTNRQNTAKKKRFNLMLSERRMNKLQQLALEKDKTMTQIIEELLDAVPEPTNASATKA